MMYQDNLEKDFLEAAKQVMYLPKKPDDKELLKLYGLYKQGLLGNNKENKPSFFDFKATSKWNAWMNEAGKGRPQAKKEYIEYVEKLKQKYN